MQMHNKKCMSMNTLCHRTESLARWKLSLVLTSMLGKTRKKLIFVSGLFLFWQRCGTVTERVTGGNFELCFFFV